MLAVARSSSEAPWSMAGVTYHVLEVQNNETLVIGLLAGKANTRPAIRGLVGAVDSPGHRSGGGRIDQASALSS